MIDLSKINAKLKSREKRTHQNVAPLPKEIKELAKARARLQTKVSLLERDVRKQLGSCPALPAKATVKPAPAKKIYTPEDQTRLERLYIAQEERRKLVR